MMRADARRALAADILLRVEQHVGFIDNRETIILAIEGVLTDHLGRAPTRIRLAEVVPVVIEGRQPDLGALVDRAITFEASDSSDEAQ